MKEKSGIEKLSYIFKLRKKQMLIGYARVSIQDQNPDLQRDALEKAGCERIYEEKISGTFSKRPEL